MALVNLQLEKIALPKNLEQILAEKGYYSKGQDGLWVYISDPAEGSKRMFNKMESKLMFRLSVEVGDASIKKLRPYVDEWALENGLEDRKKNERIGQFLLAKLKEIDASLVDSDNLTDMVADARDGYDSWAHMYVFDNPAFFKTLCKEVSGIVRALALRKFAQLGRLLAAALEDEQQVEAYKDQLWEDMEAAKEYPGLWADVNAVVEKWGLTQATVPLVALAATLARRDTAKQTNQLAEKYDIPATLAASRELQEAMFFELQQAAAEVYGVEGENDIGRKVLIKRVLRPLANALAAFGYGIQPDALACVVILFEHDSVEGIGLDWYELNEGFDADDFGYTDGEIMLDMLVEFFQKNSIQDLLA